MRVNPLQVREKQRGGKNEFRYGGSCQQWRRLESRKVSGDGDTRHTRGGRGRGGG